MVEYPTDISINEGKDIHLDPTNDLATVSGTDQLRQSVAIDVMDELQDFVAGRLTGQNIGQLEEKIRQGLDADPQLGTIRNVTIDEYNRETATISISVSVVESEDFSLTVAA